MHRQGQSHPGDSAFENVNFGREAVEEAKAGSLGRRDPKWLLCQNELPINLAICPVQPVVGAALAIGLGILRWLLKLYNFDYPRFPLL